MRLGTISVLLVVAASLAFGQTSNGTGSIKGRVLDDTGRLVQGAKIYAKLRGALFVMGAIGYVESKQDGSFLIDHLDYGSYDLYGMKEEDGFPNTSFWFYGDKPGWKMELRRGIPRVPKWTHSHLRFPPTTAARPTNSTMETC